MFHCTGAHGSSADWAEFIVFRDASGTTADALSISLPDQGTAFTTITGVKVYEIQIIADSTGQ